MADSASAQDREWHRLLQQIYVANEALNKIKSTVDGEIITEPNFIKFKTGIRKRQWVGNCVAVGLSSGFMEPLSPPAYT